MKLILPHPMLKETLMTTAIVIAVIVAAIYPPTVG